MSSHSTARAVESWRLTSHESLNALRDEILQERDPQRPQIVVCHGTGCLAKIVNGRVDGERAIRVEGDPDHPLSQGGVVPADASALQLLYNDEVRVTSPMLRNRKTGEVVKITWSEALDQLGAVLVRENRNIFIEIQGHTDATGTEEYNYELGLKRAESVRRHLSDSGIPLHRMSVISYGESKPVADNGTREGRRANRRVVFRIKQGEAELSEFSPLD